LSAGKTPAFGFKIGDLAGDQFPAAGCHCNFAKDSAQIITRH
jgi:hypothetical protein